MRAAGSPVGLSERTVAAARLIASVVAASRPANSDREEDPWSVPVANGEDSVKAATRRGEGQRRLLAGSPCWLVEACWDLSLGRDIGDERTDSSVAVWVR